MLNINGYIGPSLFHLPVRTFHGVPAPERAGTTTTSTRSRQRLCCDDYTETHIHESQRQPRLRHLGVEKNPDGTVFADRPSSVQYISRETRVEQFFKPRSPINSPDFVTLCVCVCSRASSSIRHPATIRSFVLRPLFIGRPHSLLEVSSCLPVRDYPRT